MFRELQKVSKEKLKYKNNLSPRQQIIVTPQLENIMY